MAISSRALNDLYQLSSQGTFEQLFELSVSLKRFYTPRNIFGKDAMEMVSFPAGRVDRIAENLTPEHYKQDNAKPITTRGDGNCLFNAASLALCGSEKLSTELRVRTTIELVENLEFYKSHPMLLNNELKTRNGNPWSVSSIFQGIIFSNYGCEICAEDGFNVALEYEVKRTAQNGTFSGLLQIMGLASAIGCQIHLIYPDTRHTMLSLLNGIFLPRSTPTTSTDCSQDSIIIMWTSLSGWPDRSKEFRVNHFVPVLPINTEIQNSKTEFWNVVGRKSNVKQSAVSTSRRFKIKPRKPYDKDVEHKLKKIFDAQRKSQPTKIKNLVSDKTAKRSPLKQWVQPEVSPKNKGPVTEDTKLGFQFSMPLLTRNWFEKIALKGTHKDLLDEQSILSMPLLSRRFYFKATDCTKTSTQTECGDHSTDTVLSLNTGSITDKSVNDTNILKLEEIDKNEQTLSDLDKPDYNEEIASMFESTLPYLSKGWYQRRGRLSTKNDSRKLEASTTETIVVNNTIIAVQKPSTGKGIEDSVQQLNEQLQNEVDAKKRAELHAIMKVAEFLLTSGPIVSTQEAGKVYAKEKNLFLQHVEETSTKRKSSHLFSVISRHLNVIQFYLHGKAYIVESGKHRDGKIKDVIDRLNNLCPVDKMVNDHLQNKLACIYNNSLKFMDTKRDRDILKGLFAKATSVNFTAKLQGTQNKTAIMNSRDELCGNLNTFAEIERTSMIVNNSMTNEQQRLLTKRIVAKRKDKEMKLKIDSRGCMLKCEQWPELAKTLEYIFNAQDVKERGGGGLEAHPRLKNDILFRSKDNNTFMWQAHKIINAVSPPSFNISLSSCYNYTMSYKINSTSAKRHHHGMDVNAKISLHQPPHTRVDKLVVNLHYSTTMVNYACDYANIYEENTLVDSKDAKRIVCGDITPVQHTGKVWTNAIEYPDHDWDQSRTNAVTPMTHLLLRTETVKRVDNITYNPSLYEVNLHSPYSNTVLHITRTGKAITLINPSLLERDTTIRLFHEILLLLTKPSLDSFFRNPKTGQLKEEFFFIVDNGPAEEPSSPLVQMLLVRLQKLLKLDRVLQISFAEYHSKRNFVERVHATENKLLARHGSFSSCEVHKNNNIQPRSKHHVDNMEKMTENVMNCLRQGRYDGKPLEVFRGVKNDWFLFNDEQELKNFLSRTEEAKENCDGTYSIQKQSPLLHDLVAVWNIDENFEGKYIDDYKTLNNTATQEFKTAWRDKYITAIYRGDNEWRGRCLTRQEFQAIPDYIRWVQTNGELHYVSYERLQMLHGHGKWEETPGLFRPDRLLNLFFMLNHTPLNDVYATLAVLVWLPQATVVEYFQQKREQLRYDLEQDTRREKWRKHPLYSKKMEELCLMCKKEGLPTLGQKHHLVEQLAELRGETQEENSPDYDGDLNAISTSMSKLRKFPVARIRYILNYHGITACGTKEDLVLRLFLVCHGRYYLCFKQEEDEILKTIGFAEEIIQEEKRQFVLNRDDMHRKRTYTTKTSESQLHVSNDINFKNLQNIFEPIKSYVKILKDIRLEKSKEFCITTTKSNSNTQCQPEKIQDQEYEEYFSIGVKVKIRWTNEEIGDSGWRSGWYTAQVQESHLEDDIIQVLYFSEPECVYSVCVSEYLALGKLKLA